MGKRVVITGMGAVTPFGEGVLNLQSGLSAEKNTVTYMNDWPDLKGLKSRIGACVPFIDEKIIPRKFRRSMSKMSIFAVKALQEALIHSNLDENMIKNEDTACILGSTTGSPFAIEESFSKIIKDKDISELTSMSFFKGMSHTVAANIANMFEISGPVFAPSAACASSAQAIGLGYDFIKNGKQKIVICGGAEELHPATTCSFDIIEATSINFLETPQKTPRPFDSERDGLVCGEGAGILILEELEHAQNRGANILCEIGGYYTNSSNTPLTQSDAKSLAKCMQQALFTANLNPSEIDYINAHATGTFQGDKAEADAIFNVFGSKTPVSSLKGYIAHTLGASGAIESIASILMMQNNIIYNGLNLDKIAEDCCIINLLRKQKAININNIIKNSFAFGGINISIVFRRFF